MTSPETKVMKVFSYENGNKIIMASKGNAYYIDLNTESIKEFEGLKRNRQATCGVEEMYNRTNCDLSRDGSIFVFVNDESAEISSYELVENTWVSRKKSISSFSL